MCACNQGIGKSVTLADAFLSNKTAVSAVFAKYGLPVNGTIEATPDWAVVGAAALGDTPAKQKAFIAEVSQAAANGDFSNADGSNWQDIANNIGGLISGAVTSGTQIANTVLAYKNNQPIPVVYNQGTNGMNQGNVSGMPYYQYQQPPIPQQPTKIGGFTTGQVVFLALLGAALVGAAVFIFMKKKP